MINNQFISFDKNQTFSLIRWVIIFGFIEYLFDYY